ncbi:MAG: hypothetical protein IRY84_17570 [Thermobispora bispora]|nr:hypothetical protein [Thermobispora bispora]
MIGTLRWGSSTSPVRWSTSSSLTTQALSGRWVLPSVTWAVRRYAGTNPGA